MTSTLVYLATFCVLSAVDTTSLSTHSQVQLVNAGEGICVISNNTITCYSLPISACNTDEQL